MKTIIFDFYNTLYNPKTRRLFRGTRPLLSALKSRFSLVLVTSGSLNRKQELDRLQLPRFFRFVVLCRQKNRIIFRRFIRKSQDTLIIGDREEEEILIGKRLGSPTLLVRPQLESPIATITSFIERLA